LYKIRGFWRSVNSHAFRVSWKRRNRPTSFFLQIN
jgi:hypothetical protein